MQKSLDDYVTKPDVKREAEKPLWTSPIKRKTAGILYVSQMVYMCAESFPATELLHNGNYLGGAVHLTATMANLLTIGLFGAAAGDYGPATWYHRAKAFISREPQPTFEWV